MAATSRKTALFIQAEKLRMARQFREAIPAYEAVLREDPDDMQVRKTLAGLYLMDGDPKRSLVGYMMLATCLVAAGRLDDAAAVLARVKSLDAKRRLAGRVTALEERIAQGRKAGVPARGLGVSSDQLIVEFQEAVEEIVVDAPATDPEEPLIELEASGEEPELMVAEDPPARADAATSEPELDAVVPEADVELEDLRFEAERDASDGSRSLARLSTTLFEHIPPDALSDLIEVCERVHFPAGTSLFLEESESDSLLLLAEGMVSERSRRTEDGAIVRIGGHGPGELLGLMAFLSSDVHDTSFIAETDCDCYRIGYDDVESLMGEHVELGMAMMDAYRDHVIATFMRTSSVLSSLEPETQAELVTAFEIARAHDGETIIREGTDGDDLYFVKKGSVKVVVTRDGREVELGRMGKHAFFGEMSFIAGAPRSASVIATAPTEILKVAGEKMRYLADEHPDLRDVLRRGQQQHLAERRARLAEHPDGSRPA